MLYRGDSMYEHIVHAEDSLTLISELYGISIDCILRENPELRERPMNLGQKLKIPIIIIGDKIVRPEHC